jgi:hypothetical protein
VPGIVVVKSKPKKAEMSAPAEQAPPADAGPISKITLDDGGVLSSADCEKPEIKDNQLEYLECTGKFKLYAGCANVKEELDKLDCQAAALEGNDWLVDSDAGTAGGGEALDAGTP